MTSNGSDFTSSKVEKEEELEEQNEEQEEQEEWDQTQPLPWHPASPEYSKLMVELDKEK